VERVERVKGQPEYLSLIGPTYLAGWFYERRVNTVPALAPFRTLLIAVLRKPQVQAFSRWVVFYSPPFNYL
jgi:hypothetical protein